MNSLLSLVAVTPLALAALLLGACSDDADTGPATGGSAGSSAGTGGSAGSAGSGTGGSAGSGSMADNATAMSFFVTSAGSGEDGGNLGGLSGADARCQAFAAAVGAAGKTWHAYLSTATVNARDRIGAGPWHNQAGDKIADSVEEMHTAPGLSNGNPQHILNERGTTAPRSQHDILTGSLADGTLAAGLTCADWTSNSETLTAQPQVGHSDIPGDPMYSRSWNAAHTARDCSQAGLVATGGAGRLYCFAIN